MAEKKMIQVKNRSMGVAVYKVDDIRRKFMPGETKKIPKAELEHLTYIPGGQEILTNFLQIVDDEEVIQDLGIHKELEYDMSEVDIYNLMKNGTIEEFLDCLDFAPQGVKDIIKKLAVEMPLENTAKRKAIKDKTGFDVTKAIEQMEAANIEDDGEAPAAAPKRRVQKTTASTTKTRRATKTTTANAE